MNTTANKPWLEIDASPKLVEEVWNRFERTKECAEQVDFPKLLICDKRFTPLYQSLKADYDQYHAQMFIYGLSKVLDTFEYC